MISSKIIDIKSNLAILMIKCVELSQFDTDQGRKRNPDGTWTKSSESKKGVIKQKIENIKNRFTELKKILDTNVGEHMDSLSDLVKEKINYLIHDSDFAKDCNSFFLDLTKNIGKKTEEAFNKAQSILRDIRKITFKDAISKIKDELSSLDPMVYAGLAGGFGVFVAICGIVSFGSGVAALGSAIATNAGTIEIVSALSKMGVGALWSLIGSLIVIPLAGKITIANSILSDESLHEEKPYHTKHDVNTKNLKDYIVLKNTGVPKRKIQTIINNKDPLVQPLLEKLKKISEKEIELFGNVESLEHEVYVLKSKILEKKREEVENKLREVIGYE